MQKWLNPDFKCNTVCLFNQGKFNRREIISKYTKVSQNSGEDGFLISKNLLLDDEYVPPIKKTKKLIKEVINRKLSTTLGCTKMGWTGIQLT